LVIVSIHQPSSTTYQLFDKLLLLSAGRMHYFGLAARVGAFFDYLGYPMPLQMNPAEFVLELMNVDFAAHQDRAQERLEQMQIGWLTSTQANYVTDQIITANQTTEEVGLVVGKSSRENFFAVVLALLHRSFIKSYRDVVVYGVRVAMYTGTTSHILAIYALC
jgi:ABC-type multidrug transport system ATPase subunit